VNQFLSTNRSARKRLFSHVAAIPSESVTRLVKAAGEMRAERRRGGKEIWFAWVTRDF
jgi:hypothetical protein